MDLTQINYGKVQSPPLLIVYGKPGIGKTAFGIGSNSETDYKIGKPEHLLMNIDYRGADRLECARLFNQKITGMGDIKNAIESLISQKHNFSWLIIDDLSTLEEIFVKEVCRDFGVSELNKIEYAKGFELAKEKWHVFLDLLLQLQTAKSIGIVLIGHTKIEQLKDPMSEAYSHHNLQLDKRSRDILNKAVDLIGFAHKKVVTKKGDDNFGKKESVPVGESTRVLTFAPDIEGFNSKDRFGLPKEILLDWSTFETEINNSFAKKSKKIKKENK